MSDNPKKDKNVDGKDLDNHQPAAADKRAVPEGVEGAGDVTSESQPEKPVVSDTEVSQPESEIETSQGDETAQQREASAQQSEAGSQHGEESVKGDAPDSEVNATEKAQTNDHMLATSERRGGIGWLILLLLLGWGATAGAGYWFWLQTAEQHRQLQAAILQVEESSVTSTQQKLAVVDRNLTQFRGDVNAELKNIEREALDDLRTLTAQLEEHEARLNGQQERLASLSTTTQEDWLLAEAQYLLKLANQRVLMERTPDNAVALLVRADEIIERVAAGLGDRELFAIRKQLASETTALKLVQSIDVQGLYLRLGALAEAIHTLPTVPTEQERFVQPSPDQAEKTQGIFGEIKIEFANLIQFFRESFSIRAEDELANPIVTQQRLQLMQLNTRLLIEQAQIALLKEDSLAYQESLKTASKLMDNYYFESPQRAALSQELSELATKNIAMNLPDISKSLGLLHSYVAQRHRLGASGSAQAKGSATGD